MIISTFLAIIIATITSILTAKIINRKYKNTDKKMLNTFIIAGVFFTVSTFSYVLFLQVI